MDGIYKDQRTYFDENEAGGGGGQPSIKNTLSFLPWRGKEMVFTDSNGLKAVLAMKNCLQLNHMILYVQKVLSQYTQLAV